MSNVLPLQSSQFDTKLKNFVYGEYPWDHIPAGIYQASFHTWITYKYHNDRLVMIFSITDMGEHFGTYIPAFYGVQKHIGKPEPNGRFKCKPTGHLIKSLRRMMPDLPKRFRLDRVPMSKLFGNMYQIQVVDVKRDQDGNKYDEYEIYSKVKDYQVTIV